MAPVAGGVLTLPRAPAFYRNVLQLTRGSAHHVISDRVRQAPGMPMADGLRKTGIPLMEEIRWGSHIALFYETTSDLIDTCAAYFAAGLRNNESCLWAVVDSVTVEAARGALRDAIPDLDRHEAAGSVELVPGREFYLRHGKFDIRHLIENRHDRLCRARERGFDGLRISGNAWAAASEREQYFDFRRELARAAGSDPILALGTYELGASRAVDVLEVVRVHHLTIARRQGEWQFMETPE